MGSIRDQKRNEGGYKEEEHTAAKREEIED